MGVFPTESVYEHVVEVEDLQGDRTNLITHAGKGINVGAEMILGFPKE